MNNTTLGPENIYDYSDPTLKTHRDPHGAEYAVACLKCGRVHSTQTERRDIKGNIIAEIEQPSG